MRRHSPLWQRPDFLKFWAAASVSLTGDAVTVLALPLIAIGPLHASPAQVGLLGGAQFLPFLIFGLPSGAIVDRLRHKRRLLVAADAVRAIALASVPAAFIADALSFEQLYAVAFFNGIFSVFFDVAAGAYLPALLARDELVDGNSKLELSRSSAQVIGPGAAGILIELLKAPFALVADAASFLISGVLLGLMRAPAPAVDAPPAGPRIRRLIGDVVVGTSYVFRQPYLRAIALTTTTANFFRSGLIAVLLVYLVREGGASAGAIGAAFAVGNVGFVGAAMIAPTVARRFGIGPTILCAVSVFGPAAVLVAAVPAHVAIYATGAMILIDGFGIGLHGVNQVSLRQALTPERLRGRMTATLRFMNIGSMPLGMMLGGLLGSLIGLRPAIWACTAGLFLAALPYALSSTGRLRALPSPPEERAAVDEVRALAVPTPIVERLP
jgi:MFS family permease